MTKSVIHDLCSLTRIDSCLLVLISVLAPSYFHEGDFITSLKYSSPLLVMSVCAFIINDINDIEKDLINNPDRPIPSKRISLNYAIALYFIFLFLSLLLVKILIPINFVYLYVVFIVMLTNYNYMVSGFPYLKNLYVSITSIIPIIILSYISPGDYGYMYICAALFFFIIGREMFMDIEDMKGDAATFVKIIGEQIAVHVATLLQVIGTIILALIANSLLDFVCVAILISMNFYTYRKWFSNHERRKLILIMKMQMLLGIYFLF